MFAAKISRVREKIPIAALRIQIQGPVCPTLYKVRATFLAIPENGRKQKNSSA
jgi:hypothetical protein